MDSSFSFLKKYKPIFSYGRYSEKTAYMNWRIDPGDQRHNFIAIAGGYMDAGINMAEFCLIDNNRREADELIFPMLFNVDHGIELYLKAIMWTRNLLEGKYTDDYENGHDIAQLLSDTRALLDVWPYTDSDHHKKVFDQCTESLQAYIDELYSRLHPKQKGSSGKEQLDFSRYPTSSKHKEEQPYFYVESKENVVVDLENFAKRFSEMKDGLDNICWYFDDLLDNKLEALAEEIPI